MKYLGFMLVVALVAGQILALRINKNDIPLEHSDVLRGFSEKLQHFLENKLRVILREGNATLGIPPLDPFTKDLLELKIDEVFAKGDVKLAEVAAEGFAGYQVDEAKVKMFPAPKIIVGLTWPRIQSRGLHAFDITLSDLEKKFGGNGTFTNKHNVPDVHNVIVLIEDLIRRATLETLSFHTEISLGIAGGVNIKGMKTKISLGELALSVIGLVEDDDASMIISATISVMVPHVIETYQTEITTRFNDIVIKMANDKLAGYTISEILGMIN